SSFVRPGVIVGGLMKRMGPRYDIKMRRSTRSRSNSAKTPRSQSNSRILKSIEPILITDSPEKPIRARRRSRKSSPLPVVRKRTRSRSKKKIIVPTKKNDTPIKKKKETVNTTHELIRYIIKCASFDVRWIFSLILIEYVVTRGKSSMPLSYSKFFDLFTWKSHAYVGILIVTTFILSIIPFGHKVSAVLRNGKRQHFVLNGLIVYKVTICGVLYCFYSNLVRPSYIMDNLNQIQTAMYMYAFVISCFLFVFYRNRDVPSKSTVDISSSKTAKLIGWMEGFVNGYELNPQWLSVNLKLWLMNLSMILSSCVALAVVFDVWSKTKITDIKNVSIDDLSVYLNCLSVLIMCAIFVNFNKWIVYTYGIMSSGLGFEFVNIFVFITHVGYLNLPLIHLYFYGSNRCLWAIVGGFMVSVIGLSTMLKANLEKYNIKTRLMSHESKNIIGSGARRLYSGSLWGVVRHPNYLGNLIFYIGLSMHCQLSIIPWLLPLYTILIVIKCISRVEESSKSRHGSNWVEYCRRVPFKLIPGLY
ncbi:C-14 sterol reductase, partial [Intoshia linei]